MVKLHLDDNMETPSLSSVDLPLCNRYSWYFVSTGSHMLLWESRDLRLELKLTAAWLGPKPHVALDLKSLISNRRNLKSWPLRSFQI
jgi:hypothetical protein